MEEHANGNYPLEKLITFYDFEDYQKAIEDSKRGVALKAVLTWKQ